LGARELFDFKPRPPVRLLLEPIWPVHTAASRMVRSPNL
jgi:hypothetical protein